MEQQNFLNTNWNILDRVIAKIRYSQVDKYVIENGKIVDIGCGQEGEFLLRHKDRIMQGYGLDYKINNHIIDNIIFINNSQTKHLPISKNDIDVVFLNAVLEHLPQPKNVLLEALSLLKKGGKIVMTTPTPLAKPVLELMAYKLHIINESEIREHVHYYSRKDIEELIKFLNTTHHVKLFRYETFELGLNSLIVIEKE